MGVIRLINYFIIFLLSFVFANVSFAITYPIPKNGDIVGKVFTVSASGGDTLALVAKRYDMSLHEMLESNPQINPRRRLRAGQKVIVPARFILPKGKFRKHGGIVINLSELRLYYFTSDGRYVMTYPVAVGRRGWRTPTTSTHVVRKAINPDWNVPKSIQEYTYKKTGRMLPDVVPGGTSANPLGAYAIYLGKAGILIHGTNAPSSIGKFVSSGCIRLAARDIEELYYNIQKGARVYIINHAHKAGWSQNKLYLESHIPVRLPEAIHHLNHDSEARVIKTALAIRPAKVNWQKVKKVVAQRNGIPQVIGHSTNSRL